MIYKKIEEIPINLKGKVAIKLHMGDECKGGKHTHISPEEVRVIVEKIKANGGEPFLVDTTVLYKRKRETVEGYMEIAKINGFGGFPIKIDGPEDFIEVKIDDGLPVMVSKSLAAADSLLVLSHATGHITTGFAGAIKNLGMGGVVKEEKARIHRPCTPLHNKDKCISCGQCVEACPYGFLKMENKKLILDTKYCPACGRCIKSCKRGALYRAGGAFEKSFDKFARAAKAVLSVFKPESTVYITTLNNITMLCDCADDTRGIICKDMGYLTGNNPLHIDKEAADMIKKQNPTALNFRAWDLFAEKSKKYFS